MVLSDSLLEMRGIEKRFDNVIALADVNLTVKPGEIHALCGENGAGKSTLMKILSGFYPFGTYVGDIFLSGVRQSFLNIRDSERAGIAIIHQELSLIPEMSVGENIFIGHEPHLFGVINWNLLYARAQDLLSSIGLKINPKTKIKDLGVGQQQMVEIAKALSRNPRLLVLDEPTSALAEGEVQKLLKLLKDLKTRGVSSVLISHKLNEVLEVANHVTILRDGTSIKTFDRETLLKESPEKQIISHMVGRELKDYYPRLVREKGEAVLEIKNLSIKNPEKPDKHWVKDVSFKVHKGEILGIAGLMGAGRTELLQGIFGAYPELTSGEVIIENSHVNIKSPHEAIEHGLSLLPEDRKKHGVFLNDSVLKNMSLTGLELISPIGIVNVLEELSYALEKVRKLKIKTSSITTPIRNLSGGNQQKVVFAKCLMTNPKILFLDEPTRGIDVGAKREIYYLMNELAQEGLAIVMVSSELPEILGVSDRVLVMSDGRLKQEFSIKEATQEKIMQAAMQGVH